MSRSARTRTSIPALVVLLGVAVSASPELFAQDKKAPPAEGKVEGTGPHTITLTKGERKAGEIKTEHATKLVLKMGSKEETFTREQITRVDYGPTRPAGLNNGDRLLASGNFTAAADAYLTVGNGAAGLHKPHGLYHAGRALARGRLFARAAQAFADCAKADPTGWWVKEATREAVRCYIRANDMAKAQALADGAQAIFATAGVTADEATYLRAIALEANNKPREATQAYVSLAASRDPMLQQLAEVGRGRGDLADSNWSAAEGRFRKLLEKEDTCRAARAGAGRGLGDAIFRQSDTRTSPVKLRQAAAAYAEALAVHFPGPDDPTADREATLASAAEVYDALALLPAGTRSADAAKKASDGFVALAAALREELATLYPAPAPAGRN